MKEDRKESILETAEKLFSEQGFNGASTRAIANEAGVNMAMLNYYFGSKEGLYKAVFERRFKGFHQTLLNLNEEDISSWEKLYKYIDIYVDKITRQNCFQRLMQYELSLQQRTDIGDFIKENMCRNANEIRKILVDGIDNGTFKTVDIDLLIATLFGTKYYIVNLSGIASALFGQDLDDKEIFEKEIKPRLKKHLKDLLDALLKPQEENRDLTETIA